jgi:hypothetical protein
VRYSRPEEEDASLKKSEAILALVASLFTISAGASELCVKGSGNTDVCAEARKLSDGIASMLPMRMSQNMSWESVMAIGGMLQAHVRLSYDKKHLEEVSKAAGVPVSQARAALQRSASNVCQPNTATRAFIQRGGSINYVYLFADGEQFTSALIDTCS